jgi:hypothetical protein
MAITLDWSEAFEAIDIDSPRYDDEEQGDDDIIRATRDVSREELLQILEDAETCWDEVRTQHLSECSLAGDSWPGAAHDVQRAFKTVVELRKKLGLPHRRVYKRTPDKQHYYEVWANTDE